MEKPTYQGTCRLCEQSFAKTGISRHLKICVPQQLSPKHGPQRGRPRQHYQLQVDALPPGGPYWLQLLTTPTATLADLDQFLRLIWLECCNHLSAFHPVGNYQSDIRMKEPVKAVFDTGTVIRYEYDFGSTTPLSIKCMGVFRGLDKLNGSILLLAQNAPPEYTCQACQSAPATCICTECIWDNVGLLCDACAADHECGEEMLLPLVNSPRAGVCGYTGPKGEPPTVFP